MANIGAAGSSEAMNTMWTWAENKKFEIGLVEFPDGTPNRWEKIAASLGTKSAAEVEHQYAILLEDILAIEARLLELPPYPNKDVGLDLMPEEEPDHKFEKKQSTVPRKIGKPWTEEEHKLFLQGLEIYGKGDWKSISRYVVQTRNPTQVASHAQKYFERQEREEQNKKRRSIFDSTVGENSTNTKPANN
ncbi:hypothetical protein ACS0TY_032447 [Phlomoides rotata]